MCSVCSVVIAFLTTERTEDTEYTDILPMKKFELAVALVLLCFAVSASGQTKSKDDAALTALVKQMANAQVTFDRAALDRIFTSDYIEISPAGEFDPRAKVLGFYEKKPEASVVPALDVSEFSIRSYGKFAIVIAKLTYLPPADAKGIPARSMRATFVCRKENGGWKIASSQYTGVRPTPPLKK